MGVSALRMRPVSPPPQFRTDQAPYVPKQVASSPSGPTPATATSPPSVLGHDFRRISVLAPADPHERTADQVAARVMASPADRFPQITPLELFGAGPGRGRPLDAVTRAFFEPRLGVGLAGVSTHADGESAAACRALGAQAFAYGREIYYGAGHAPGANELTAHELAHVMQQRDGGRPVVRRKLELRPPGKGEASAFGRAQELIDRLNGVSPAIQYTLNGNDIAYTVVDASALTHFDLAMRGFIDRAEIVPMRLITGKGYVGGGPLFADSFVAGYVDLDDLLADDTYSFQSDLLHFLTERFTVKNYDKRLGTNMGASFPAAHRAGKNAEAAQLQALFDDPSIVFVYEEVRPNDTWVNAFKSKSDGYWVFQVVRRFRREVAGGEMWVQKKDGTRVSMDDFRQQRAAAKVP